MKFFLKQFNSFKSILRFAVWTFCFCVKANAQSLTPTVVASQGDYFSSASGSVSWTLGEIMGETYTTTNILTQGFQQPKLLVTAVTTIEGELLGSLFPNPINNNVNVIVSVKSKFIIYDMLGKQIGNWNLITGKNEIDLSKLADGMYQATLINTENNFIQSFKIIKSE